MGTSASLPGMGGGSPLVPSWIEDPEGDLADQASDASPEISDEGKGKDAEVELPPLQTVAPRGPMGSTRRALTDYVSSGDRSALRRSVGNYVRTGRGGAATAAKRSAGSASRGARLAGIVSGDTRFSQERDSIREAVQNLSDSDALLAAIAAVASPSDGTIESQIGQDATAEALQHLLTVDPDADLFALNPLQREILLERYLAIDAYELFMTENSLHLQTKCSPIVYAQRAAEIYSFFCETFEQANEARGRRGESTLANQNDRQIQQTCRGVVADAYFIFEEFLDEG